LTGYLSRDNFNASVLECMGALAPTEGDEAQQVVLSVVLDRLFTAFDQDGNGFVDFSELASGLSVLCGGDRASKVRASFELYDYNGDGFISLDEMTRYLTSVYRVMYSLEIGMAERMGDVSPEQLGQLTAENAFAEADLGADGRLSYDQFKDWYLRPAGARPPAVTKALAEADAQGADDAAGADAARPSLQEIRLLTGLASLSPSDAFEALASRANEDGVLDKDAFDAAFDAIRVNNDGLSDEDENKADVVLDRLFEIFDENGDGVVDFTELSSGVSVLCGGSRGDKVAAAFSLYDFNGDGFISLDEMQLYLKSVFRVLFEAMPTAGDSIGVSSDVLAEATAEQCFADADLNNDGRLSFDEFKAWPVAVPRNK